MDLLTRRWRADCREAVPAADPGAVDAVGADLLTRWREPHRAYHDPVHLTEVLAAVDTLSAAERLATPGAHPVAILAGWFHDVVYEPDPGAANEVASADLARHSLALLGAGEELTNRVVTVVLDTIAHDVPPDGADEARPVFHDADLWVLSAPVARFDEYCQQVRREFGHVTSAEYAAARAAVLRPFLVRPHIYLTDHAQHEWEPVARENLARELTRLAA
ncbi:MAG: hypothetical protein WBL35_02280 [Ornithinibacter sp.]